MKGALMAGWMEHQQTPGVCAGSDPPSLRRFPVVAAHASVIARATEVDTSGGRAQRRQQKLAPIAPRALSFGGQCRNGSSLYATYARLASCLLLTVTARAARHASDHAAEPGWALTL